MIPKLLLTALAILGMVALACSSDEAPEPQAVELPSRYDDRPEQEVHRRVRACQGR